MNKQPPLRLEPPENDIRKHFAMIPNMLFEMGLSLQAFRLIAHMLYINADCFKSTRTLAKECQMSVGSLIAAKRELHQAGLITITETKDSLNRVHHSMRTVDLWNANYRWQADKRAKGENVEGGENTPNLNDTVQQVNDTVQGLNDTVQRAVCNKTPLNKTPSNNTDQDSFDPAKAVSGEIGQSPRIGTGKAGEKPEGKGEPKNTLTQSQSGLPTPPVPAAPPAPRKPRTPRPADAVIEAVRAGSFGGAAVNSRIAGVGQYLLKAVHGEAATAEQGQALADELTAFYAWYPQATNGLHAPTSGEKIYGWLQKFRKVHGAVKPPQPAPIPEVSEKVLEGQRRALEILFGGKK